MTEEGWFEQRWGIGTRDVNWDTNESNQQSLPELLQRNDM
jgi:hypothetical protein